MEGLSIGNAKGILNNFVELIYYIFVCTKHTQYLHINSGKKCRGILNDYKPVNLLQL